MISEFAPQLTRPLALADTLRGSGFAVMGSEWVSALARAPLSALSALAADWEDMPLDGYLRDGGHYRRRRHASFTVEEGTVTQTPHRAHFQSPEYNALHGGLERWFEPMRPALLGQPAWSHLLMGLARLFSELRGAQLWFVEAHQFRIDTREGIGRPTPEGAHRDGVDFVALFLIAREHIRGGETRVFAAEGPTGQRFTLSEPWSALLLDDRRMIHESTPIQPERDSNLHGHRDTLVLTFRGGGFQELR